MEPVIERLELAADDALLNTVSLLQRQLRDLVVTAANEAPRPAPVTRMRAREILRARAMRARFFNPKLFADPAWDMLLDMCRAHHEGHQVSVTSLCLASGVPSTTALRWVRLLEDEGLIERHHDPRDGRRTFLELTTKATEAEEAYFAAVGDVQPL